MHLYLNNLYLKGYTFGFQSGSSGLKNLDLSRYLTIKVPHPSIPIQQQIVAECEKVDEEYSTAQKTIEENKRKIEKLMSEVKGEMKRLDDICFINQYAISPNATPKQEFIYIDIDAVENGTGLFSLEKRILGSNAPLRARRIAKSGSTVISTVRPNLKGFIYIEKETKYSIFSTGFAILQSKNEQILLNKMIYYIFMFSENMMQQMIAAMPKGQYPSINKDDIENFMLPVPSLAEQQRIVQEIENYEAAITTAKLVQSACADKKKKILEKWL